MGAMSHSVGNAQCLDEERRHARGQAVGLGFLIYEALELDLPLAEPWEALITRLVVALAATTEPDTKGE